MNESDLENKWVKAQESYVESCNSEIPELKAYFLQYFGKLIEHKAYVGPGKRVLDLGCGTGKFDGKTYKEIGYVYIREDQEIFGCDVLPNEVFSGTFTLANAENLPYQDGFFDQVLCVTSLDHFVRPLLAFQESYRVLKPGGRFAVVQFVGHVSPELRTTNHKRHIFSFSLPVMATFYDVSGFKDCKFNHLVNDIYLFLGYKDGSEKA